MKKKLSLAIYWHMHQPLYELEGTYLMPWVRLHAVKDYLDMVLFLEKFPNLKLNFNIVPSLIDSIIDYTDNGYYDIHSELTSKEVKSFSDEEKAYVLNNFFSAKFETMIYRSEHYKTMYQRRFANDFPVLEDFSDEDISDLMALFNLVWIDPVHFYRYPKLRTLWDKQYGYTLEDRLEILNIQKQIMSEIIPTYKKYLQAGRIELTTSPYYHPILPILINLKAATKYTKTSEGLPDTLGMLDDARYQIKRALDRMEEIFGVRPQGLWPPELCIGKKSLTLFAQEGIKWTISDEGVLASSTNTEFIRDFKGNLNDPYHLLKVYDYKTKSGNIDLIFRDRSIPGLINFEYAGINPKMAAADLYDKIKTIQNKLLVSPDDSHLLTIATDSENCWENYQNDGIGFLDNIYSMLEEDSTLETVLISDYIKRDKHKKILDKIQSGSWIDRTFQYWIGDIEKNKAWMYLKLAKDDFTNYIKQNKSNANIESARKQILVAQGSDWFWWYGEPNNSGQDFVFDYMFRERLKNMYTYLGLEVPDYLNHSIITTIEIPFKYPRRNITPRMDGLNFSIGDWYNSGILSMLDGPVFRENKIVDKINFGCDGDNIYFRLHINKGSGEISFADRINQFYIYTRNASNEKERAYIRLISKTDNPYPVLTEKFERELTLTLVKDTLYPVRLTSVLHPNMWTLDNPDGINIVYNEVIDICIPFDKLGVASGETVEFFMANTDSGVKNTYIPQEILFSMTRG